ncbi:transcriptional regulator PAI 2-type [Phaeosphaeriaceae sp. PMI808]|nr:transcriptional regulator PAI 2-type [Phaeosphaeriaceae sp. PMI808]
MYLPAAHAEKDIPSLLAFIHANPLGILTTAIDSPTHPFLQSSHIPWVLDVDNNTNTNTNADPASDAPPPPIAVLRGHMARANPQAKAMMEHLQTTTRREEGNAQQVLARDVMVLFNGPAHHYVTPKFYTSTKPLTGKVVPTWNYAAVQVYGRARVFHDSKAAATSVYLDGQVRALTQRCEVGIMGFGGEGEGEGAWEVDDAPAPYVEILKKAIIGVQIEITGIGGKYKMSQEMPVGDRVGVVRGFEAMGSGVGDEMARTVRERGKAKEDEKT